MTEWAITPCEDCDNVHMDTRKWSYERWACTQFPILPNMNPVAPKTGLPEPPFNRCTKINGGYCPLWKPRKSTT